ncbi:helix-turn-helix transcriptional regulator [Nocardia sienata]|uniref:helix-turn-helix transcriptional regulator n=1 Tax=Nocardia sienata TaxID=248552 RepID=UPI0007A56062|nr:helix-turn-helix transcriptional regulator [Nocardia sienata]
MLSAVPLAARPEFAVTAVTCRSDHARWSEPEARDDHRLVLVRRGRFRRQSGGGPTDLDPTVGYLGAPGEEERFAHPAGGDICTAVTLAPELWERPVPAGTVYVDARIELAHRRLLGAAGAGDIDYALAEELLRLVALAAGQPSPRPRPADRALVAAARAAILDGAPESDRLPALAALLRVSPYRLSRTFSRHMGTSLTRYRNRVRVGRALDRLTDGDTGLADIAAHLGFADQAHLTRTVREHLGYTPVVLRRLLTAPATGRDTCHRVDPPAPFTL